MMECFAGATGMFEVLGSLSPDAGGNGDGEEIDKELKILGFIFYNLSIFIQSVQQQHKVIRTVEYWE